MSGKPPNQTGPLVVCLPCGADDQPRRIAELEALARDLAGTTLVESVSGRTTAIRVVVPETAASRFVAALVFNGATVLAPDSNLPSANLIVLVTDERRT